MSADLGAGGVSAGGLGPVEQVVLVDEEGAAIGTTAKAGVHHADTPLHLAFSCYVFDGAGRVLLTQRAAAKPTWGGVWTNTVCGHPAPGEPLVDAVRRRAGSELGLELDAVRLLLPSFRYRAVMAGTGVVEHELCPVFVAQAVPAMPGEQPEPRPDPTEVDAAEWVPWEDFRARALRPDSDLSPWSREQVAALPADPLAAPAASEADLPAAARPA